MARRENDRGPVDAAQRISGVTLDLRLTPAQQTALDAFLEEQRNPSSPEYHNWLTPEQFVTASPTSFARTGSTSLTVTVKPTTGSAAPSGTVTFSTGSTQLGITTLTGGSTSATATFKVSGASLTAGIDTITVTYSVNSSSAPSSGTVALTVT